MDLKESHDWVDGLIYLVSVVSSVAGLKLLKFITKWSSSQRERLRVEWREDLLDRNAQLALEVKTLRESNSKLNQKLKEEEIKNAVLNQQLSHLSLKTKS